VEIHAQVCRRCGDDEEAVARFVVGSGLGRAWGQVPAGVIAWAPAVAASGVVPVRDSKDPAGPALAFSAAGWRAFIAGVRAGEFPSQV
jgi:hypothetical protein